MPMPPKSRPVQGWPRFVVSSVPSPDTSEVAGRDVRDAVEERLLAGWPEEEAVTAGGERGPDRLGGASVGEVRFEEEPVGVLDVVLF